MNSEKTLGADVLDYITLAMSIFLGIVISAKMMTAGPSVVGTVSILICIAMIIGALQSQSARHLKV
jgi:hypothetical protein